MTETLDGVSFDILSNTAPYKANLAEIERATEATGARIKAVTSNFFADTQAGSSRLIQARRAMLDLETSARATGRSMAELAAGSNVAAAAARSVASATAHGGAATATAAREFRALFDELSSGRARLAPGTLAIIATRVFGISGAAIITAVAIAAIPTAIIAAAASADAALARLKQAVISTGYAAGVTSSQLAEMGQAAARQAHVGVGTGNAVTGIMARGNVPADLIQSASTAAINFGLGTGQKPDKAAKELEQALAEPEKGARDLAERFKLLNSAQVEEVRQLVETGHRYSAQQLIIDATSDRFKDAADAASILDKMLRGAASGLQGFWKGLGGIFGAGETTQEQLTGTKAQLANMDRMEKSDGFSAAQAKQNALLVASPTWQAAHAVLVARLDRLQAAVDTEGAKAKAGGRVEDQNAAIDAALAIAEKNPKTKYNEDIAIDRAGLVKAKQQLADLQAQYKATPTDKLKGEVGGAQTNVDTISYDIAHRKVPGARGTRGLDNAAATAAAEAEAALAQAQTEATLPERDRAHARAQFEATRRYLQQTVRDKIPDHQADYARERTANVSKADAEQAATRRFRVEDAQDEASAQERLARAFDMSGKAAAAQKIADEAARAYKKGEIDDEKAYAAALERRASAEAAAASAQRVLQETAANQGLQRAFGAGGNPAAIAAAQRETEALAATKGERDNAVTKEQIDLAAKHLAQIREELGLRDQLNRYVASAATDIRDNQNLQMKQLELSLLHATAEERAKEISQLQTLQQMEAEGWSRADPAFQQELQYRTEINQQIALMDATLSRQTESAQVLDEVRNGLTNIGVVGTKTFVDMRHAAAEFLNQLASLIMQLYVMKPLLNMLMGSGGQLGGLAGNLWSGITGHGFANQGASVAKDAAKTSATTAQTAAITAQTAAITASTTALTALAAAATAAAAAQGASAISSGASSIGTGLSTMAAMFGGGMADGGALDPSQFYLVGERGPEVLGPGISGRITPIMAPDASTARAQATGSMNVTHNLNLTVSGNGDADLMAKVQAGTQQYFHEAIKVYDKQATRAIRGRLAHADKRSTTP